MIGFGDVHKKQHMYRALIEGLGYGLYDGLLKIEKAGKMKKQGTMNEFFKSASKKKEEGPVDQLS